MNQPTPDQSAAHEYLSELRTRISTQPLPYQYGVDARALESLWEIFDKAREIMRKYPGCEVFAAVTTNMLNMDLRPVTAKWHKAYVEGRLNSRDGGDEFRGELAVVQKKLQVFAAGLHSMAYGTKIHDRLSPPAISPLELRKCLSAIPFGVPAAMRSDEAAEVQRRRTRYKINTPADMNAVGLALSGGGIRSATFSLGVIQVLAARNLFKDVDFLSTVSGGGYTGSFLSVRLDKSWPDDVSAPYGPDPSAVRYVRHHAKFLSPTNFKDAWSIVAGTLAGMLLNWTAPFFVVALGAAIAILLHEREPQHMWPMAFIVSGLLLGVSLIAYCVLLRGKKPWPSIGSWILGISSGLAALVGICRLVYIGHARFSAWMYHGPGGSHQKIGVSAIIGAIVASGPSIVRFLPLLKNLRVRRIALQAGTWLAGLVIPVLALLSFYLLFDLGRISASPGRTLFFYGGWWILIALGVMAGVIATLLLNVNLTAPHKLYRDRLAKTFVQGPGLGSFVPLSTLNTRDTAPYHLINATLNLPSSQEPALRDRKCDFFLFTKHWIGSNAIGYSPTASWKMNGKEPDLATAMAISGAAASSHMGLLSQPAVTALLTFLNVRMGFWIHNPRNKVLFEAPGFSCLLREMLGVGMSENAAWLNVSDGGHIENLAIFQLLRRQCKFIICVDGESDANFAFGGLMTVVRHAQIDCGIRIEPRLNELRPDPKTGFSQTHAQLCRIHYPPMGGQPVTGLLLYMKLSVTGNETELIHRYKNSHPEFPHESTADQFFDQEQFEAYRELGVHVAEALFSPSLMNNGRPPVTIPDWFERLASNLLAPEIS